MNVSDKCMQPCRVQRSAFSKLLFGANLPQSVNTGCVKGKSLANTLLNPTPDLT